MGVCARSLMGLSWLPAGCLSYREGGGVRYNIQHICVVGRSFCVPGPPVRAYGENKVRDCVFACTSLEGRLVSWLLHERWVLG